MIQEIQGIQDKNYSDSEIIQWEINCHKNYSTPHTEAFMCWICYKISAAYYISRLRWYCSYNNVLTRTQEQCQR